MQPINRAHLSGTVTAIDGNRATVQFGTQSYQMQMPPNYELPGTSEIISAYGEIRELDSKLVLVADKIEVL